MDAFPIIDWKTPKSVVGNKFTKYGQQIEKTVLKVYNCPGRILSIGLICPLCEEVHTKPKRYTGNTYLPNDKIIKPMGIKLPRRDIPCIVKSVSQQEINNLLEYEIDQLLEKLGKSK